MSAEPYIEPGRCAESMPGLFGQTLGCDLVAGHDGMHHDGFTGADWCRDCQDGAA